MISIKRMDWTVELGSRQTGLTLSIEEQLDITSRSLLKRIPSSGSCWTLSVMPFDTVDDWVAINWFSRLAFGDLPLSAIDRVAPLTP